MPFSEILGQDSALKALHHAQQSKRLPHAWLFTGPPRVGKSKTALALAQWLNCERGNEDDACGQCPTCRQIAERNYPDCMVLEPDGKNIRIAQVHQTLRWLQLRADRAKVRVLIVDGAQHFNRESANAFLKTLEEPPAGTLIVLIAEAPAQLLETLVSRCQLMRFRPLADEQVRTILAQNPELSEAQITTVLPWALGSVPSGLVGELETLAAVQQQTVHWLTTCSAPEALEEILCEMGNWGGAKSEAWRLMLDFLERWFRDVSWLQHGLPETQLLCPEFRDSLDEGVRRFSKRWVLELPEHLARLRESIELNANKPLALETLWLHLLKIA
ncbi:MAG: DNA polymerase III subunit delta' [SAR324 cluster bacterium]|nr:DNA polymerase III subunit delta' [SAR324 cluster bacterium]|tara:strand:- start:1252 stop:2241 length:990 start_codon:yes stop_codon:yes gene_type:complete